MLIADRALYKGRSFRKHRYVGDPLNTLKLYNELAVDELMIADIAASKDSRGPDLGYLGELASEAFMPLSYGGGIKSVGQMEALFAAGYEKVLLNTAGIENPNLVREASRTFGSQSIVLSIDYKKVWYRRRKEVWIRSGSENTGRMLNEVLRQAIDSGAGEIVICSIEREGRGLGYDLESIKELAEDCSVPLVVSGGAGALRHLAEAHKAGASAMAAGSLFIFQGPHRAVLVNYPNEEKLDALFANEDEGA